MLLSLTAAVRFISSLTPDAILADNQTTFRVLFSPRALNPSLWSRQQGCLHFGDINKDWGILDPLTESETPLWQVNSRVWHHESNRDNKVVHRVVQREETAAFYPPPSVDFHCRQGRTTRPTSYVFSLKQTETFKSRLSHADNIIYQSELRRCGQGCRFPVPEPEKKWQKSDSKNGVKLIIRKRRLCCKKNILYNRKFTVELTVDIFTLFTLTLVDSLLFFHSHYHYLCNFLFEDHDASSS